MDNPLRTLGYTVAVWAIRGLFLVVSVAYLLFFLLFSTLLASLIVVVAVGTVACQVVYYIVNSVLHSRF